MPIHFPTRDVSSRRTSSPGLVVYVTCGDPDLSVTKDIVLAAIENGADAIELGVPFSDPVADGPVIQRASERAVRNGTSLEQVLKLASELRRAKAEAGLIIFSYLNPILRMGMEAFADAARGAGIDGALMLDLPVEEADVYLGIMRERSLDTIFLVAPTSPDLRLKKIAAVSSAFVYAVSRTGVTGAQQQVAGDAKMLVSRMRKFTKLPIALGFGVSNAEQFQEVGEFADAVAIGSAIVRIIEEHGSQSAAHVGRFIKELKILEPAHAARSART